MTQIHVDEVYPKNITNPMLVNFQNGYATDNFTSQECFLFDNAEKETKTIATALDGLVYAGEEEKEDLGKTLILARNKSTGKVRVIETSYVELKPVLKIDVDTSKLLETSSLELSRKFGSKKQKQQMEQREKLKVNIDTVTEQMQNVTQDITEDKVDLSSYNKTNSDDFYIPPINRDAEKAEDVYNINSIFTEEQYDKICSELDGKDYANDMIPIIKNIAKKDLSPKMAVLAVYANSLLQLYGTMMKEISKKSFTICPHSITINNHVLDNFLLTSNGKRTRPAPYKDKSLCYAIVFILVINNLKLELDSLCESIKITPNTASHSDLLSLTSAVANVKEKVCREQGYRFLDGLLLNKRWALKMFDASAKSPQGLLFGSSYHLGNFDECVGIDEPGEGLTVEGQYCLATIKWRQSEEAKKIRTGRGETLRWAVCVPSACDAKAVAGFVGDVLSHTVGNSTGVEVTERDCYTRKAMTVTKLDIAFLGIIFFFGLLILFTTSYELYIMKHPQKKNTGVQDLIIAFSLINNLKKILSTKQNNSLGLECINGIKALAMIFIIAGHACLFIGSGPVMDAEAWDRLIRDPINAFMLNNTLLVDTFLFLSAFLFSRLLLIELDKRRGRLNVLPILIFRYIRVTPAYLIVILFYMTWLPKIGEGPLWEGRLQLEQERCMEVWWANILYINNYISTDKLCMFQSWYLAVDTQLFFVAPIFIYSLWHWRRFGAIFTSAATFISLVIPAVITYKERLDPTLLFYAKEFTDFASNYYFVGAYIRTHMKMTPYFMGILTGYILHRIQLENYQFSTLLKTFGWTISLILGTVTTFSVSLFYQEWYQYSELEATAYISLHKFAWSIANGWLVVACATGNGGVLGKLLNWKFLVPIARLTFCAYLVNGIVELYYVGQLRHPLHITFFTVAANAISHIVLTFFLALILCIIFESPLHGIEKILLRMFARPVLSDNAKQPEPYETSRNTSQSTLDT